MSVRVVPYESGGFEVDVRLKLPNGVQYRERKVLKGVSKSNATRWGQDRERFLLQHGPNEKKEVPTLEAFSPKVIDDAEAHRQKPSSIAAKERILRNHLVPLLGKRKLDAITNEDVQRVKSELKHKAPKTVNNVLTVLSVLLKKAVEWGVIEQMPCTIKLLKVRKSAMDYYDFGEYERLVSSAAESDWRAELIVLFGGEAGLRSGEIVSLEWNDIDHRAKQHGQLTVQRSAWKGIVDAPKSGRVRYLPLTRRLAAALRRHRHLKGPRVMYQDNGQPLTEKVVQNLIARAARGCGLRSTGPHMLRHTFCSHLAMRGASAKQIQELAGHQDLTTTQRYMHLSPAAVDAAIALLDQPAPQFSRGAGGEAADSAVAYANV
jgi:integrase